uniref:LigA n=1 Tax=Steinernema glaseri TaxID=37863 RepID=A0A1I7XW40_9BILA
MHLARGGRDQAVDHLEGGALAAPGRAEEHADLAFVDRQAYRVDGLYVLAVAVEGLAQGLQQQVGEDGQQAHQHGADQQHRHVAAADGGQDKYAKATGTDGRGNGHHADVHHHGGAYTSQNHRHRNRQLDHAQALAEGHADAAGGFAYAGLDVGQRQVGVAQDRQQ